jgi:hypothetical protein
MTVEFQNGAWEEAIGKGGKFVEAALKALHVHAGNTVPPTRQFKADNVIIDLGKLPVGSLDDSIPAVQIATYSPSMTTIRQSGPARTGQARPERMGMTNRSTSVRAALSRARRS